MTDSANNITETLTKLRNRRLKKIRDKKQISNNTLDDDILNDEFDRLFEGMNNTLNNKKCECGAKKVKTTHSLWCPKYTK